MDHAPLPPEICLVTAVSRPENLSRVSKSIEQAQSRSTLQVRWILVLDEPVPEDWPSILFQPFPGCKIQFLRYHHPSRFGIEQKNLGMAQVQDSWYHCLDDDNIVHPFFFQKIHEAMEKNPQKHAFVFGQERWDRTGNLKASPGTMEPGKIDNTMFVVHGSLIGNRRYDPQKAGFEDYYFFKDLFETYPGEFVFLDETLSYYNYLRHFA